jgi:hypothetical protein
MRGAWLATLAAAALVLCSCGGGSADDPADAEYMKRVVVLPQCLSSQVRGRWPSRVFVYVA